MKKEITEAEWLNELVKLSQRNDDGLAIREISEKTGRGKEWICRQIQKATARNAVQVGRKYLPDISGRLNLVPCYKFLSLGKGSR